MKKITSYESFKQEYHVLLDRINDAISSLAQYQKINGGKPEIELAEKLNRLKLHRRKLEQMLEQHQDHKPVQWLVTRTSVRQIYRAALEEYRAPAPS